MTDVLRTQPGFRVTPRMTGVEGELVNLRTACAPEVFLDGVKVTHSDGVDPSDSSSRPPVAAYRTANVVVPTDIEIIEVYTGPAVLPAGLSTRGLCGVLTIWTKRGP